MPEGSGSNETNSSGNGQAVTVVISSGSVKWLVIGLLALMVMLFLTNRTSVSAELKANQAVKTSEDQQTEYRMVQFWLERAKIACDAKGVNTPGIPASFAAN